jgi:hypothetical protein
MALHMHHSSLLRSTFNGGSALPAKGFMSDEHAGTGRELYGMRKSANVKE